MFCSKCGTENPDNGSFCRSCGKQIGGARETTTLGGVPLAPMAPMAPMLGRRGRPISYESAMVKIFTGLAFLIIACILGYTGAAGGRAWWFWMLIPGFGSLGTGIAHWLTIKNGGNPTTQAGAPQAIVGNESARSSESSLPPAQQQWASSDTRYRTGDLVPPSVTESTTKLLEVEDDTQATRPLKN